jgi:cell division protein FtsI/penicillin-binding protein 2
MRGRYRILMLATGLVSLLWIGVLFTVQVLDIHKLNLRHKRYVPSNLILVPMRGAILDSNGSPLVNTVKYYQVDLDLVAVKNTAKEHKQPYEKTLEQVIDILVAHTDLIKGELTAKIAGASSNAIMVTNHASEDDCSQIESEFRKQDFRGFHKSFSCMKRTYAHENLGARLLGSVRDDKQIISNENFRSEAYALKGNCGVELSFDDILRGEYGWKDIFYDGNHKQIPIPDLAEVQPRNGYSVQLTINSQYQEILEKTLTLGVEEYHAENGIGIIMDPDTGAILAMAGINDSDRVVDAALIRSRSNFPMTFNFEPGSTFKPFTALLALENKLFRPDEPIDCRTYVLKNRTISDSHSMGFQNLKGVIVHSSNVGIAKVAERVGERRLYERLIDLGFGQVSGCGIRGESPGLLRPLNRWDGFSLHSISFGQEIGVTALQMASGYSTLANGGKVMRPYIVDKVFDENHRLVQETRPEILRTVSDRASLDTLKTFLHDVVEQGTGTGAKLKTVSIAGKTGTAQIIGRKGESTSGKFTGVFAGFFPVENPRITMIIAYDQPDHAHHFGAQCAVPTFRSVAEQLLGLPACDLVPKLRESNQSYVNTPNFLGKTADQAEDALKRSNLDYKLVFQGRQNTVIDQYPKPGVAVDAKKPIVLIIGARDKNRRVDTPANTMPDLYGLTIRNALNIARERKIILSVEGSGTIISQTIPIGTPLSPGIICKATAK